MCAIKKGLLSYSGTSFFFTDIYRMKLLIGFAYGSILLGFRAISISFLKFLSQKTYPGEFLRLEVILSRSYLRKCSTSPGLPTIINLSFF